MTDNLYSCRTFTALSEFRSFFESKQWKNWAFRGQRSASWKITTSLDRALDRFAVEPKNRRILERGLERAFQRSAHQYLSAPPLATDYVRWWALMQHHGAPTRLSDWTYSPYIALFFAAESAGVVDTGGNSSPREEDDPGNCVAVWCVDVAWVQERALEKLELAPEVVEPNPKNSPTVVKAVLEKEEELVYPLNPFHIDERLQRQQGLFLASGDVSVGFMSNLSALGSRDTAVQDNSGLSRRPPRTAA